LLPPRSVRNSWKPGLGSMLPPRFGTVSFPADKHK
jgi:hypothetical protein